MFSRLIISYVSLEKIDCNIERYFKKTVSNYRSVIPIDDCINRSDKSRLERSRLFNHRRTDLSRADDVQRPIVAFGLQNNCVAI